MIGSDAQIQSLNSLIHQAQMRHTVISHNIANLNTPGYRAIDVTFQTQLQALSGGATAPSQPHFYEIPNSLQRQDGNTVDLDLELGKLQSNNLMHQTYVHVMASQLGMIRTAITGT